MLEELGDVSQSERNQKLRLIFNSMFQNQGTDYNGVNPFGSEFYLIVYYI